MFALLGFCTMTFWKSCSNSGVSTQMWCTTFLQTRGGVLWWLPPMLVAQQAQRGEFICGTCACTLRDCHCIDCFGLNVKCQMFESPLNVRALQARVISGNIVGGHEAMAH